MECSKVRKEIDRFVYQPDPDPAAEIIRHVNSCKECAQYLEKSRLAAGRIAAVRNRTPILKNPEGLTEDIMNVIRENSVKNNFDKTKKSGEFPVVIILRRLLAAASVCLFLLFGYEEYVVVDKISRLEKQNAAISQSSQYQSALNLKKAMGIFLSDPEMTRPV